MAPVLSFSGTAGDFSVRLELPVRTGVFYRAHIRRRRSFDR
jgi:hypothetical protein